MQLKRNDRVTFDDYVVDRRQWLLEWKNEPIAINRKTFDLLLYLIDHRERVVGKEEVLQTLWPDQFVEESNLTQHVFLLRKALSRHPSGRRLIETVPGRGYRFTASIAEVQSDAEAQPASENVYLGAIQSIARITFEEEDDGEPETAAPRHAMQAAPAVPAHRPYALVASSIALLIVFIIVGWVTWQRRQDHTGGSPVQVVLTPMDGSTGDPGLDRALVSSLRMDLSQSPFVSVVAGDTVRATLSAMKLNPDAAITVATAREVCERTNSQAVLHGTVAKDGQHFLITEEATSCVDGSSLAADKQEASRLEELPHSIDTLAASIRRKLGESRRSIARFSAPLLPADTSSLEALKAFSEAERLGDEGRMSDAISLFKRATAADPDFAVAYSYLAAAYFNTGDPVNNRAAIQKAYELRNSAAPADRLFIIAHHDMEVIGDLYKAERDCQTWAQLYPRSPLPWNSLSVVQRLLGRYTDAVVSATRAETLRQKNLPLLTNLAVDQMQAGDLHGAKGTCDRAIASGVDGDRIRSAYLSLAFLLHDPALMRSQRVWFAAHPQSPYFMTTEARIAIAEGRFSDAHQLIVKSIELLHQQGLDGVAASVAKAAGASLIEAGDVKEGKGFFQSVPIDPQDGADLVGLIEVGNMTAAGSALREMHEQSPDGTLLNLYWGPRVEAALAAAEHRPGDAIAALETARPLEKRGLEIQKFRADTLLADRQFAAAEKEYRNVLAHPEFDPTSAATALSWLGLGRSLAAEGQQDAAKDAYQHFVGLWAYADPNAAFLKQAKEEQKSLQRPAVN